MRDSPKVLLLIALVFSSLASSTANAQSLRARGRIDLEPIIRTEGLSELVGDLIIECSGGTPTPQGQPFPLVDFEVELNTQITSRTLENGKLEAVMLIDDPTPNNQIVGKSVFPAVLLDGNRMQIPGVIFDPPGQDRKRILRLRNVRVDASALDEDGSGEARVTIQMRANGILEGPLGLVREGAARTQRSLLFSIADAAGAPGNAPAKLLISHDNNRDLFENPAADFSNPGGRSFTLRYEELRKDVLRRRVLTSLIGAVQPQSNAADVVLTESGFFNPDLPDTDGLNRAGLADHGTRLIAKFQNVPDGVAIFATVRPVRPGSTRFIDAELVASDENGEDNKAGGDLVEPTSLADRGIARIPIEGGRGQAVWEIVAADLDANDTVSFGVTVAYLRDAPKPASVFISGGFAPISEQHGPDDKSPLPRFAVPGSNLKAFELALGEACPVAIQDVVLGGLDDPLKDDLFSFDALTGTLLDLQVKSKGKAGPVLVRLFDPALREIDVASFLKTRGKSTKLSKFPLFDTGEYLAVLRAADGSPLDYRMKVRGKLPREQLKVKSIRTISAPGETLRQEINAVEGSILEATLKGKNTNPEILEVEVDELGTSLGVDAFVTRGAKTEKLKGLILPVTGRYSIVYTGLDSPGTLTLNARVKAPGRHVLQECVE